MKTEERVMAIIHRYDSDAKVDDQLKDDLMFDSLDMLDTAMSVEKEFSISITDEEMEDPMWDTATVQDLIDFVDRKLDEKRRRERRKLERKKEKVMTKEYIDKAAVDSCVFENSIFNPELTPYYEQGFKDGANWRINSVWNKDIQNGKTKKPILVKFDNGLFNLFKDIRDLKGIEDKVSIFAYIEDLLPIKEDNV